MFEDKWPEEDLETEEMEVEERLLTIQRGIRINSMVAHRLDSLRGLNNEVLGMIALSLIEANNSPFALRRRLRALGVLHDAARGESDEEAEAH